MSICVPTSRLLLPALPTGRLTQLLIWVQELRTNQSKHVGAIITILDIIIIFALAYVIEPAADAVEVQQPNHVRCR